jgi:excisionase family DNA binding protein
MNEQAGGGWLSIAEAMPLLNLSDRTIRKRIAQGIIPAAKEAQEHGGAQWRIPRNWVEEYSKRKTETENHNSETEGETEPRRKGNRDRKTIETENDTNGTERATRRNGTETESETESNAAALSNVQAFIAGQWSMQIQQVIERSVSVAVAEAVAAAQAPLLEEIRQLRAQVERLSESRQEPQEPQAAVTTVQPPEPLREDTEATEPTHEPLSRWQALRQLRQAMLKLMGWR